MENFNEKAVILEAVQFVSHKRPLKIKVCGESMHPVIQHNDVVIISKQTAYSEGDILLFTYKNEGLLLHRLVKQKERLFCKGDNAFRIEDVSQNEVIGKVVEVWRNDVKVNIPVLKHNIIALSYQVGLDFQKERYNQEATMQHYAYKTFIKYLGEIKYEKSN